MTDTCSIRNYLGERLDAALHPGTKAGVLLVLGHGVTGNKDRPLLVALAEGLAALGWPCLRLSFSGNGESEGKFEYSCITKEIGDLKAALDSIPANVQVAYVGHSMGGAVGVMTAAKDARIRALISVAGMTHTADFVKREFGDVEPDAGCMWDEPECPLSSAFIDDLTNIGTTLSAASEITCPWLLIHGEDDDVVPIVDGQDAFAAAKSAKEWLPVPDAGHSFGEQSYPLIIQAIDTWLNQHFL